MQKKTEDGGYNDLFGESERTASVQFSQLDLQRNVSLGHEPLFPGEAQFGMHLFTITSDVDEAKIQPTVGLGSVSATNNIRVTTPQKV